MKTITKSAVLLLLIFCFQISLVWAQVPQAINFQAIARDGGGNPMVNTNIQIRLSVIDSVLGGTIVYQEQRALTTNAYGSFSFQIGVGANIVNVGTFQSIDWVTGSKYLKIDYDPTNMGNFSLSLGVIKFVTVPYAFAAEKVVFIDATGAQNGDALVYNSATGKFEPGNLVADGSETKVLAGSNITVTGTGTTASPYVISGSAAPANTQVAFNSSQTWTVPSGVSVIKVELWGGAGGGGGAGVYSYSLNNGGDGGSGGYSQTVLNVVPGQQYNIVIGQGGSAGSNAMGYSLGFTYGDNDGGDGGDTWFDSYKAAGGTGGIRGGYSIVTYHGISGSANIGSITGSSSRATSNILDNFQGLPRSYLNERVLTSKPGSGGSFIPPYSYPYMMPSSSGEDGYAIITFL